MRIIANGKVYNTENPNWDILAEYNTAYEIEKIYRTKGNEYVYYNKQILDSDVPTPPIEKMFLLMHDVAYAKLSNFRGIVYYDKFEEA